MNCFKNIPLFDLLIDYYDIPSFIKMFSSNYVFLQSCIVRDEDHSFHLPHDHRKCNKHCLPICTIHVYFC